MGNKIKEENKIINIKFIGEIKKGANSYLINLLKGRKYLDNNIKLQKNKDMTILKINAIQLNLIDLNNNNNKINNDIIADCIVIEYDINDTESYEAIKLLWKEKFKNNKETNLIYLIGIKIDSEKEITKSKAESFSLLKNLKFLSVSNKNDIDINNFIDDLVKNLVSENNSKIESKPLIYKACFIGDSGVGAKTSLINAIMNIKFNENESSTTACSFATKIIKLKNNQIIELHLWDTIGQEKYRNLTRIFLSEADCFVLGFDVTSHRSFEEIRIWHKIAKESSNTKSMYLIGNKIDLYHERKVSEEEARNLAKELNLRYFEVSCKTGARIDEFVEDLVNEISK